jgi:hypothetical protein
MQGRASARSFFGARTKKHAPLPEAEVTSASTWPLLRRGNDVELAVDSFDVHPHGVNAQGKNIGNFLVRNSLRQVIQNFPLAFG